MKFYQILGIMQNRELGGIDSLCLNWHVYDKQEAIKCLKEYINSIIADTDFIIDENTPLENLNDVESVIRVFYKCQDNWDDYDEYIIYEIDMEKEQLKTNK